MHTYVNNAYIGIYTYIHTFIYLGIHTKVYICKWFHHQLQLHFDFFSIKCLCVWEYISNWPIFTATALQEKLNIKLLYCVLDYFPFFFFFFLFLFFFLVSFFFCLVAFANFRNGFSLFCLFFFFFFFPFFLNFSLWASMYVCMYMCIEIRTYN